MLGGYVFVPPYRDLALQKAISSCGLMCCSQPCRVVEGRGFDGFSQKGQKMCPSLARFRGGQPPLKMPFFGVRRYGAAFQSSNMLPHSKRTSAEKESVSGKIEKVWQSLRLTKLLSRC